jgi:hypothetical protein
MRNYHDANRKPRYTSNQEFNHEAYQQMESGNYSEGESDYEFVPALEINEEEAFESDYENDYEHESDYEADYEQGFQEESEYADNETQEEANGYKDEMEAELENVTNEQEFEDWVNEITVHDHRTRNIRPVLRTPAGRTAVRRMSAIASRTLPYLGVRRGGWKGAPPYRKPVHRRTPVGRRKPWNWHRRPGFLGGPQAYNQPSYTSNNYPQPYPGMDAAATGYNGPAVAPPQQDAQDGSFKNFVLDTIKNLNDQISKGNQTMEALKNSMVNSAAVNMPDMVQPKADATGAAAAPPPPSPGAPGESETSDFEFDTEMDGEVMDNESSFSEETELELASELLTLQNESEMDYFITDLIKKAVGTVSSVLKTPQGKAFKSLLKSLAKKAIPLAGMAVGVPPIAFAGELNKEAEEIFELELDGLSNEDREFEVAKAIVRFGGNASRQLADQHPGENIKKAVNEAAMRYAPGMLNRKTGSGDYYNNDAYRNQGSDSQRGTWYRRGNKIIILNAY